MDAPRGLQCLLLSVQYREEVQGTAVPSAGASHPASLWLPKIVNARATTACASALPFAVTANRGRVCRFPHLINVLTAGARRSCSPNGQLAFIQNNSRDTLTEKTWIQCTGCYCPRSGVSGCLLTKTDAPLANLRLPAGPCGCRSSRASGLRGVLDVPKSPTK